MRNQSSSAEGSPVKLVSLGQGEIDRKLSWSDFKALQDRIDMLEKSQSSRGGDGEEAPLFRNFFGNNGIETNDEKDDETETKSVDDDGTYELPESTYTLMITENICSLSFLAAIVACTIAIFSLVIVLINELDNGDEDNPLGLPAGVTREVRMAQFLGVIIGVLMEEEIPLGLEILAHALVAQRTANSRKYSFNRIVLSSILRLCVGYLFLLSLFLTVIQESDVLDIFFDVLALEFVETIDDVIFGLSKRGFFGRGLKIATHRTHFLVKASTSEATTKMKERLMLWANRFIRLVYLFNGGLMIAGLVVLAIKQQNGDFRCHSMSVQFGDNLWEESLVILDNGTYEKRLLLYSHFSGIYVENGTHDGRPKYTEQNKERGDPFINTIPAEIVYCEDDEAWVFRHERIRTSANEENENECNWLLKSAHTDSYDIIELTKENAWSVWTDVVVPGYEISITCNECYSTSECNYHGNCIKQKCHCSNDKFGIHCEYDRPCQTIRSEKSRNFTLELLGDKQDDEVNFVEVYGRPMYRVNNLQGVPYSVLRLGFPDDDDVHFDVQHKQNSMIATLPPHKHYDPDYFLDDDFFETNNRSTAFQKLLENYTFVLRFTGRRWYGQISQPGLTSVSFEEEEFHGFWNQIFSGTGQQDNSTLIISDPSLGGSPVGLDFFEMRRRNDIFEGGTYDYDYDPFGVLIPLIPYAGSGFFHCNVGN
mmetsp:Transcript_22209/g.45394  ORF Transcript_22209/g.45394 Transcript_22209/m.45394 type:complete len:708 (+) Transcript_22209:228-2351(+)